MSRWRKVKPEVLDLFAAACEGEITDAELVRLESLLLKSPWLQRLFTDYCRLAAELRVHCQSERALHDAVGLLFSSAADGKTPKRAGAKNQTTPWHVLARQATRLLSRPTPLSMTIAALVIGLLITAMAFVAAPIYRRMTIADDPAAAGAPVFVANLTGVDQPRWAQGQVGTLVGSHLVAGHKLELTGGVAEVTYHGGARVILEGPASLTISGPGEAEIALGKMLAKVPKRARGFAVETKHCRVVDLGTEFAVAAEASGGAEIHVIAGRVEVQRVDAHAGEKPRQLAAGEALRVSRAGDSTTLTAIAYKADRFVRASPAGASGQVMTFTPDRDTSILSPLGLDDSNFGEGLYIPVGTIQKGPQRALVSFNISRLSGQYTQIESITLRLFAKEVEGDVASNPQVYAIAPANRGWGEGVGNGSGDPTADGDATWNHKNRPAAPWAGSAGLRTSGVDYDERLLAERTLSRAEVPHGGGTDLVPGRGTPVDFVFRGTTAELTELIDAWLVDNVVKSRPNPGLLVLDPNEDAQGESAARIRFYQSEFGAPNHLQPRLIVKFSNASAPAVPGEEVDEPAN